MPTKDACLTVNVKALRCLIDLIGRAEDDKGLEWFQGHQCDMLAGVPSEQWAEIKALANVVIDDEQSRIA